jgi:hypothetical protein
MRLFTLSLLAALALHALATKERSDEVDQGLALKRQRQREAQARFRLKRKQDPELVRADREKNARSHRASMQKKFTKPDDKGEEWRQRYSQANKEHWAEHGRKYQANRKDARLAEMMRAITASSSAPTTNTAFDHDVASTSTAIAPLPLLDMAEWLAQKRKKEREYRKQLALKKKQDPAWDKADRELRKGRRERYLQKKFTKPDDKGEEWRGRLSEASKSRWATNGARYNANRKAAKLANEGLFISGSTSAPSTSRTVEHDPSNAFSSSPQQGMRGPASEEDGHLHESTPRLIEFLPPVKSHGRTSQHQGYSSSSKTDEQPPTDLHLK